MKKVSAVELLQLYAACLRNGIAERAEEAYMADGGAYVLFIEPTLHRVSTFSLGLPVTALYFQSDNKTWDSIEMESASVRNEPYHIDIGRIQRLMEEEKGERLVKTF
jgi:hypothetical protein